MGALCYTFRMSNTYLIFSALYAPHVGGVETYTHNLAREITAAGDEVVVVTMNTEGCTPHQRTAEADIYRLPCTPFMGGRFPLPKRGPKFRSLWKAIRSKKVDYVVVNTRFYPLSLMGVQLANELGIRPVVIDHGSAHLTAGNPVLDVGIQRVEHLMTDRMLKFDADFYGVSAKSVAWLRHFGIKGKGTLCNAIDASAFRDNASNRDFRAESNLDETAFLVAYTGRLAPEKGVMQLAEAAKLLEGSHVHVLMAGDGALRKQLEETAPDNLHMLGALPPDDVASLLMGCDAFCMPTRSEGFSTSLLEASVCGLTPVITDVGGVDELVPSDDFGLVLPDTKPATIAAHLRALEENRAACKLIGGNVQRRAESEFTWKRTAARVRMACEAACA